MEKCIPLSEPDMWKNSLEGIKYGFGHTWENCRAMQFTHGFPTYLYTVEINGTRIVCPIVERAFGNHTDIATPPGLSGFIGTGFSPDFHVTWKNFSKSRGYVSGFFNLNPFFEDLNLFPNEDIAQRQKIFYIELDQCINDIYANLHTNRKREIRNWNSLESDLIFDRISLSEYFIKHWPEFASKKNLPRAQHYSKESMKMLCNLENMYMVGAQTNGEVCAVYLFYHTPYIAEWLFSVPQPEGKKYSSVLLWSGLNYFKSKNIPIFSLGVGETDEDNITGAKLRWGPKSRHLHSIKQVYNENIYYTLCQQSNADPGDRAGYFPPYRRP